VPRYAEDDKKAQLREASWVS